MTVSRQSLAPLALWKAILIFAVTSAPIYIGLYYIIPILLGQGLTFLTSYLICFYPTYVVMFLAALALYRLEGNELTWAAFRDRYRLMPVKGRTWLWVVGLVIFGLVATFALSFTAKWLASIGWLAPPNFFPSEINPLKSAVPGLFFGTQVQGQWGYAIAYFVGWCFNILGEELLWRGYMLPRQEVSHGRWAWTVQGLLWTGWHVFWKWNWLVLLPITLSITFVAQKTKNTTVVIVAHGVANFLPLIGLVLLILS